VGRADTVLLRSFISRCVICTARDEEPWAVFVPAAAHPHGIAQSALHLGSEVAVAARGRQHAGHRPRAHQVVQLAGVGVALLGLATARLALDPGELVLLVLLQVALHFFVLRWQVVSTTAGIQQNDKTQTR
jgi:hypothetical protein